MELKLKFNVNEALEMMYENTSEALNKIAEFIDKSEMNKDEIVSFLKEIADEQQAQSIVVRLREDLKK